MSPQTEQRTQGEELCSLVDALLAGLPGALPPERLELLEEGRVFFKTGGGEKGRRKANRLLSSTIHSTSSPRVNSIACAMAEGKLMYHCSLALRWMSCTLVGNPMKLPISSLITRYKDTRKSETKQASIVHKCAFI